MPDSTGEIYRSAYYPIPVPTPTLWGAAATPQGRRGCRDPAVTSVISQDHRDPVKTLRGRGGTATPQGHRDITCFFYFLYF